MHHRGATKKKGKKKENGEEEKRSYTIILFSIHLCFKVAPLHALSRRKFHELHMFHTSGEPTLKNLACIFLKCSRSS